MNYKELKTKWVWKKIDFDWVYGNQCVDFAKQAAKDLYGVTLWNFSGSAINAWNTGSPFKNLPFERVLNSPKAVPPAGAIVFFDRMYRWQTCINPYGHVAVTWDWCTWKRLVVLEQNAWSGNGDWNWNNAITERVLDYIKPARCLGWFIFKQ